MTVEITHRGDLVHLVDLKDTSEQAACRRARNAVWMAALKDGREYQLDDIDARIYTDSIYTEEG
jgi:hypothetical protein